MEARLKRLHAAKASSVNTNDTSLKTCLGREKIKAEVLHTNYKDIDATAQNSAEIEKDIKEHPPLHPASSFQVEEEPVSDGLTEESEVEDSIPLLRPVFVPKESRTSVSPAESNPKEKEAHELLVQYVRKEYEVSLKPKDDYEALAASFDPNMVDDTDGLDPATEYAEWKLRELLRLKRDREERERWEREKMEMERVRNMPEEERRKIDEEKMQEWLAKPQSQMKYMQKYYHKGAFYLDEKDPIFQRDFAQATGEDAGANREMLPELKQVRDFGKKGRTKWTHLVAEDTTAFDYGWGQRKNQVNYALINRMGGMKGSKPVNGPAEADGSDSKRPKPN